MRLFTMKNNFEEVDPMGRGINCMNAIQTTINARITPYHVLLTIASVMCYQYLRFVKAY